MSSKSDDSLPDPRSICCLILRDLVTTDLEGAQGDTVTGLYGMLKGAIQDMTMQLVTTIQTAFMKGSRFKDKDLDRKSGFSLP
jgi:hypothetical protein